MSGVVSRGVAVLMAGMLSGGSAGYGWAAATPDALDPGLRLARVWTADRAAASRLGAIVEEYDSFTVVAARPEALAAEPATRWQAIETAISLRGVVRDPRTGPMPEGDSGDYRIVQFVAPVKEAWLQELEAAGVEVLQYVPHQAFLVHAPPAAQAALAAHPKVRWVGPFAPEYKTDARVIQGGPGITPPERTADGLNVYDVAVFKRESGPQMRGRLVSAAARVRAVLVLPSNYFDMYRVEASPSAVGALAAIPGVISVEPYVRPAAEDERANHIVAGNYTGPSTISPPGYNPVTQFGVNGQNVTVSIVDDGVGIPGDGGFYVTAANTVNGPLHGAAAGAQGHGHLQASIIGGTTPFSPTLDPTGYNYGAGLAPATHMVNIPFLRAGYTGVESDTAHDTVITAGPNGVLASISNNSWGAGLNGNTYDAYTAMFDGFVRDANTTASIVPLAMMFSAGNSGTNGLTRPKTAKNIVATGASDNLRTELTGVADNIEDLANFSSRGPAADTRVKPDVTAPGQAIAGGRSGPDTLFGNIDAAHRWSSGTSHAVPYTSAAASLITQFWKGTHGGANPSPAMIKAMLINGTVEMTGANVAAPRPNGGEGWGRINLKNVLNTGALVGYLDQSNPLVSVGDTFTFNAAVGSTTQPLRITLVWTDPPGVSDPALVNDLDLEVTVGGTTYRGNVFSGGFSTPGGVFDNRNNIENVWLPAGTAAGTPVTLVVRATALNGDGILGNADATDQHFALAGFNTNPPVPVELLTFQVE